MAQNRLNKSANPSPQNRRGEAQPYRCGEFQCGVEQNLAEAQRLLQEQAEKRADNVARVWAVQSRKVAQIVVQNLLPARGGNFDLCGEKSKT